LPKNCSLLNSARDEELQCAFRALHNSLLNDLKIEPEKILRGKHYFLLGLLIQALNANGLVTPNVSFPMSVLQNASNLPLPFDGLEDATESSWSEWLQSASSRLTDKLSTGEWRGYLSNDPYLFTFGELLEDIQFRVDEDSNALNSVSTAIKSDGKDGQQSFTLHGRINKVDGRVFITQEYPGFQTRKWNGFITPFGLVGYWNMVFVTQPLGLFWIWQSNE
jgi:hypothetical protein